MGLQLLIGALGAMLISAQPAASCFPAEAGLDAFRTEWFCRQLRAAEEGRFATEPAYRFAYIPSFHPARVVMVFREAERYVVVGKILSGKGGYEAGKLAHTSRRVITADEWRLLEQRLENAGLWEAPDRDDRFGVDGAEWILEARKDGRYRFRAVWSPTDSTFPQYRKACTYMLELAGITPDSDELY